MERSEQLSGQRLNGLTFHEARTRILKTLHQVSDELSYQLRQQHGSYPAINALCKLFRCGVGHDRDEYVNHIIRQVYLILSVTATIFALYVASYELEQSPYAPSGLLIALIAMAIIGLVNASIIVLKKKSYDTEVYKTIQRITNQYDYFMKKQGDSQGAASVASGGKSNKKSNGEESPSSSSSTSVCIPTGHSQISIINTLRNGQWQKLPILMLAEGDVIALMGGDITPCKVVELISKNKQSSKSPTNGIGLSGSSSGSHDADWDEGEVIEKGIKIHILSNTDPYSERHHHHHHHHHKSSSAEYSYNREPSRSSRSDMTAVMSSNSVRSIAMSSVAGGFSVPERHRSVDPESIEILRLCGNTRCFRVLETPMKEFISITYQEQNAIPMNRGGLFLHKLKREVQMETFRYAAILLLVLICISLIRIFVAPHMQGKYSIDLFIPLATTIVLLLPLSSPAFSVMVEAFGTAEVLTTLEVAHEPENPTPNSKNVNDTGASKTGLASNSGANSPTVNPMGANNSSRPPAIPPPIDEEEQGNHNEFEDEEFIDEDLDARVEDIAEETATKVMYFRFFRYVLKVLYCRLFGGWSLDVQPIQDNPVKDEAHPLLPVPLQRTNIVGQLGAITMVCFVDDDIISENYSVTEEIFLLNENQEDSISGMNSNKFGGGTSSVNSSMRPTSSAFQDPSVKHGPHSKVTVLDLHANPEATGSRFENPNWWKFLPCLKPLGFNASLMYKFTADHHTSLQNHSQQQQSSVLSSSNLMALQENHSAKTNNTFATTVEETSKTTPPVELKSSADVEKTLVRHIRKTLPLEFLRELAEEIGFVEDDLKNFTRAIEVNVLAPGLENAHLLEDNHQWGQEESRRRGSLLPQLRGAVYRDTKGGSLQLMSLGDPSLVLHYCREYWDGSTCSIIPLSPADRLEVLNVYERWRLEDFDVVAFSYSPMPVTQLQYLTEQVPTLGTRRRSLSQSTANNPLSSTLGEKPSNTAIFFVDPSSVQDLIGRKTRPKHSTDGVSNSVPTADEESLKQETGNQTTSHAVLEHHDDNKQINKQMLPTIEDMDEEHHEEYDQSSRRRTSSASVNKTQLSKSTTISHIQTMADGDEDNEMVMLMGEESNSKGQDISMITDVVSSTEQAMNITSGSRRLSISGESGRPGTIKRSASDSNLVVKTTIANVITGVAGNPNTLLGLSSNSPKTSNPSLTGLELKPAGGSNSSLRMHESHSLVSLTNSVNVGLQGTADQGEGGVMTASDLAASNAHDASTMFYVSLDQATSSSISPPPAELPPSLLPPRGYVSKRDLSIHVEDDLTPTTIGGGGSELDLSFTLSQSNCNNRDETQSILSDTVMGAGGLYSLQSPIDLIRSPSFESAMTAPQTPNTRNSHSNRNSLSQGSSIKLSSSMISNGIGIGIGGISRNSSARKRSSSHSDVIGTSNLMMLIGNNGPDFINQSPSRVPSSSSMKNADDNDNDNERDGIDDGNNHNGELINDRLAVQQHEEGELRQEQQQQDNAKNSKGSRVLSLQLPEQVNQRLQRQLSPSREALTRGSSRTHHGSSSHKTSASKKGSKDPSPSTSARSNPLLKQQKRTALRQLWSLMRQQIFLGMVASSVPVRKDVPNAKEDLDAAGIRFVYFSPQNMKRSKPVAEKIGIPFDWNCAISLRVLDSEQHDPHRHISNYADWDVLARMPHGIEAIKEHLKTVDNVPLLVSLFTDATPETTKQMLDIFRDNGEVVLTIGAAYRAYNQNIYKSSNLSCSVFTLPNVVSFVPAQEQDLLDHFPTFHQQGLTKCDLKLSFDLIGLGSINLLQAHSFYRDVNLKDTDNHKSPENTEHLKLSVLLETVRKGRVLLLNEIQAIAFIVICSIGLSLWPLLSNLVPMSMPPSCPPPMAILLAMVYIPSIGLSMIFNEDHEGVMKNTPRKSTFNRRPRDESRFYLYLALRALSIVFAIVITGIFTAASVFKGSTQSFTESLLQYHSLFKSNHTYEVVSDTRGFWLVQDMMSNAAVLAVLAQSFSLLARGQKLLDDFPWPRLYAEYYAVMLTILVVHGLVMVWRSALRHCMMGESATSILVGSEYCDQAYMDDDVGGNASYLNLHYSVWIVLLASSLLLNIVCGFVVNLYDSYHYRRYTQFLRLEFDTRLGMHSPR